MNMKYFAGSFNFGLLASLIFVICFAISSFTSTNNSSKHSVSSSNFYTLPPPPNRLQKGEYRQPFADILQNIIQSCTSQGLKIH